MCKARVLIASLHKLSPHIVKLKKLQEKIVSSGAQTAKISHIIRNAIIHHRWNSINSEVSCSKIHLKSILPSDDILVETVDDGGELSPFETIK